MDDLIKEEISNKIKTEVDNGEVFPHSTDELDSNKMDIHLENDDTGCCNLQIILKDLSIFANMFNLFMMELNVIVNNATTRHLEKMPLKNICNPFMEELNTRQHKNNNFINMFNLFIME
jgi:hypothetical protein